MLHMAEAPGFLFPDWPAPARVRAAFTTRRGGCSGAPYASLNLGLHCGDDVAAVTTNRARVAAALGLPAAPAWLQQVHGCGVVSADAVADDAEAPRADAAWTDRRGRPCVVMVADCLPVLLCDVDGTVVAAAHAGWRGLAAGVLEAAVAALPVPASRLLAWLGPAIGPGHFEVGPEVRAAFVARDAAAVAAFRPGRRAGAAYADLFLLARQRLAAVGVTRIFGGGICTYADDERFYSYRRDGVCGRMAALIWLDV